MSRSDLSISRWLEAHVDRSAGLATLPGNVVLADVSGDGDHRLVLTDLKLGNDERSRLKVYKGTVLVSDQTLPEIPSSIVSFYTDNYDAKVPVVAVACGSDLLIYKNNKPYFKFTVPSLPVSALDKDVWKKLSDESTPDIDNALEILKSVPFNTISSRSQKLLCLQPFEREDFVKKYTGVDPVKISPITCMTVVHRSTQEKRSPSCPILATEAGQIFILDPQLLTILHQATVCNNKGTPFLIKAAGSFDIEFRIIIACREGFVCLLRRGWLEGRVLLQSTLNIIDMVLMPGDSFIMLATSNKTLQCYTKRGNKLWTLAINNDITCLGLVPLKHLSTSLLAVGMRGGAIHLYQGRHLVDVMVAPDTPSVITFGQMGQEEHVMIIITLAGAINFKILKRTADFNLSKHDTTGSPAIQTKPLPLPKRSKLFLEQSMRERQNAVEMHQNFQKDLIRLRLIAARAMVQVQSDQSGIGNEKELIKLSAQVLGLGPKFTLILSLENMNNAKALYGYSVIFHTKPTIYKLSTYLINIPLIPPGLSYKLESKVEECTKFENSATNEQQANSQQNQVIRVFVIRKEESQPVLAATINMPPTDATALTL